MEMDGIQCYRIPLQTVKFALINIMASFVSRVDVKSIIRKSLAHSSVKQCNVFLCLLPESYAIQHICIAFIITLPVIVLQINVLELKPQIRTFIGVGLVVILAFGWIKNPCSSDRLQLHQVTKEQDTNPTKEIMWVTFHFLQSSIQLVKEICFDQGYFIDDDKLQVTKQISKVVPHFI